MPPKKRNSGSTQSKGLKPSAENAQADKGSPELSVKKHGDKDAAFLNLCKSLQVTDLVCDRAWALWKSVQESTNEALWGGCLFVTVTDLDVSCFTLTQVLKAVSLNVKDFLSVVRKMDVNLDTITTKVNAAMTRLEKKYDVTLALYQRFEKTCKRIFSLVSNEKRRCPFSPVVSLLFTGRVLQMEDDLVIAFQLLLCTLEFFIKRCPVSLLQPPYKSAITKVQSPPTRTSRRYQGKAKSIRPPEPEVDVQLLETLCKENDCNAEEVKNVYQNSFSAFLDSLDLSRSSDVPQSNDLDKQYEELYLRSRDIDGRLFFDEDPTVLLPKVEILQVERTPKKNLPDEDGVIIPPQTPIRAAMTSIQQLRGDLISTGDTPSTTLTTYFKNCTVDPTQGVLKRLEMLDQRFSQRFGQAVGPRCVLLGNQRFTLGVRLYYKVMEAMLKSEEKRLSVQNFSKLLNDSTFHTSLLACALEVVMEPGRVFSPQGSPLFELLKQEHEGGAAEQAETTASFNQPLQHNHTAADLYLSPVRPGHRVAPPESPATPNSHASSQAANQPTNQTPRHIKSNSLSLFYKKLYRLAYIRLKLLCSYLLSSHPELEPIIWTLFQHTLQHEYELMRDRHLDQLMMSAMYAICKVKSVDLRFKTIVTAYKNMPNANQETFKHVLISEGHYDSIIVFYNQVFMQKLKTNILQYASPRPPPLSPIPQIPRSPYKFQNSPLRVPGSNNVYISPLKSPRMSPGIMTPRSRMLVSIGESFGHSSRFQKINQMVNSSERSFKRTLDMGSIPKPLKRLRFDGDGQDEADGSKSNGDSTLILKLVEMSNRMQEQKLKEDADSRKE
uniref:Retinoblastoma 1 n=1 Tax=Cynoglossus semilaevis TaxID=244447 RepID=A0A3P8WTC1_CYNSE